MSYSTQMFEEATGLLEMAIYLSVLLTFVAILGNFTSGVITNRFIRKTLI